MIVDICKVFALMGRVKYRDGCRMYGRQVSLVDVERSRGPRVTRPPETLGLTTLGWCQEPR